MCVEFFLTIVFLNWVSMNCCPQFRLYFVIVWSISTQDCKGLGGPVAKWKDCWVEEIVCADRAGASYPSLLPGNVGLVLPARPSVRSQKSRFYRKFGI